jgi:uncharacterized protein YuzE
MSYNYDRAADAIYIKLSDMPIKRTKQLDNDRLVDFDSKDRPVGIELLHVSEGVLIEGLPATIKVISILKGEGVTYT